MDFTILISQIQKDHITYSTEYTTILQAYKNLITLPKSSYTQTMTYINFLSTISHFYDTEYPTLLLEHIDTIQDSRIKKELINNMFILKHKKMIDDYTFFKTVIQHCDLQKILSKVIIEIRDPKKLVTLFGSYIEKGDEKQSTFSMYMICYLFECFGNNECEDIIYNGFFKEHKLQKICVLYVLNDIEFNKNEKSRILQELGNYRGSEIIKHLLKEIKKKNEPRDVKIKKLECIDIIKKEHIIEYDISTIIFKIIDPSKDDLTVLMELLVDNLSGNMDIVDKMIKLFCMEYKDDDFIVYGLNFLKEVCLRNDYGEYIIERVGIFNRHKNAAINVAYRGIVKAIKENDKDDDNKITYVRKRKTTKEEKIEMKKSGVDRSTFKRANQKTRKKKIKIRKNRR